MNLSREEEFLTDPDNNDTDFDGLNDRWEIQYKRAPGVDPLLRATVTELATDSDDDDDGFNLLEEAEGNTDPELADENGKDKMITTSTDTSSISSETSDESSFALLVVLTIFTSFSLTLVVFRIRKQKKV